MEEKEGTRRETLADNFPSNSKMKRVTPTTKPTPGKPPEDKKLEKVVTGTVKKQKRGFGKKLAEIFLEDDTKSVGSYILYDILIPAAKELISDMVGGAVDMALFGERRRGTRTIRDRGKSYTNYNSVSYRGNQTHNQPREERDISRTARARHDFDELILETRGEAEDVLSHMVDLTIDYGVASVADLYDLVGITSNFTDNKYGWTDLRSASVTRVRGGYLINLPRTQIIE